MSFTKKTLNYTQDNQPDNEHCPIRNGYLGYPSGGLGSTWPRCQLTQGCQRAFTDCLPISENSGRWGRRRKPAPSSAEGRRGELRPAGEPAMLASRDATSTEPGPGRAFTLRRRNPPENVTCRFKAFLFCFVVLFFRAASQARGAGKGARAGGPAAAAPVGRAQGGVSYSPPGATSSFGETCRAVSPGGRAEGRRAAGGEREGGNAPPRNRFVLLYLLTFGRPR